MLLSSFSSFERSNDHHMTSHLCCCISFSTASELTWSIGQSMTSYDDLISFVENNLLSFVSVGIGSLVLYRQHTYRMSGDKCIMRYFRHWPTQNIGRLSLKYRAQHITSLQKETDSWSTYSQRCVILSCLYCTCTSFVEDSYFRWYDVQLTHTLSSHLRGTSLSRYQFVFEFSHRMWVWIFPSHVVLSPLKPKSCC